MDEGWNFKSAFDRKGIDCAAKTANEVQNRF